MEGLVRLVGMRMLPKLARLMRRLMLTGLPTLHLLARPGTSMKLTGLLMLHHPARPMTSLKLSVNPSFLDPLKGAQGPSRSQSLGLPPRRAATP